MKLFVLNTSGVETSLSPQCTPQSTSKWSLTLGADSAVLRPGEPVFLPESGRPARMAVIPAVRIGRLGYCVRSNFDSYIDAVTLFMYLQPHPDDLPAWLPPFAADRSFSPGKWLPVPSDGLLKAAIQTAPLPGRPGHQAQYEFYSSLERLEIERHIRDISQFCTLKTGDLLLFPSEGTPLLEAEIDSSLSAALNDSNVLDIRLK